jgi:hypothetical protein
MSSRLACCEVEVRVGDKVWVRVWMRVRVGFRLELDFVEGGRLKD